MTTLKISRMIDRSVAVRVSNMIVPVLVLMTATVLRADDVVRHWNKVMLAMIAAGGTDPITSTRTAAIVQTAVFESACVLAHFFGHKTPFLIDSEKVPGAVAAFPKPLASCFGN
jgi:hypothetical protein